MLYLPSSSDVLGTKSATLQLCWTFEENRAFSYFSETQTRIIVRTRFIRLHEAKRSVVDGDRQETEVVRVAHTCRDNTQQISVDVGTNCVIKMFSQNKFSPCAKPTDIHWAIRCAVSFTTVE